MPQRRNMLFKSFDEILSDIALLESRGYERGGTWSLGQICQHLEIVARLSLDPGVKPMPWIARKLLARLVLKRILNGQGLPKWFQPPKELLPSDTVTDAEGVEQWKAVIDELVHHPREKYFNPVFGPLDRQTFDTLQLRHASHHLSFLEPKL